LSKQIIWRRGIFKRDFESTEQQEWHPLKVTELLVGNNMPRVNMTVVSEVNKAFWICIGYVEQPIVVSMLTMQCYVSISLKIGSVQNFGRRVLNRVLKDYRKFDVFKFFLLALFILDIFMTEHNLKS
jgi:hypothetical protein